MRAARSREGYKEILKFEEFLYILQHYNILAHLVWTAQRNVALVYFLSKHTRKSLNLRNSLYFVTLQYFGSFGMDCTKKYGIGLFFIQTYKEILKFRNFSIFCDITIFWLIWYGLHKEIWHLFIFYPNKQGNPEI